MIPFFMVHYGGFCAVHGFFVLMLFGKKVEMFSPDGHHLPCFLIFLELLFNVVKQLFAIVPAAFIFAFAALFISHGNIIRAQFSAKGRIPSYQRPAAYGQPLQQDRPASRSDYCRCFFNNGGRLACGHFNCACDIKDNY